MTDFTIVMLTAFQTLVTCELSSPEDEASLDLAPLQSLPLLDELTLCAGHFFNLGSRAKLLTLRLQGARVFCTAASNIFSTLTSLELSDSTLSNLHAHGLSACTQLQALECVMSDINGTLHTSWMTHKATFSVSVSKLVALKKLRYHTSAAVSGIPDDWMCALTALEDLDFCVNSISGCELVLSLTARLTALTNLKYVSMACLGGGAARQLVVHVDWHLLPCLRRLQLQCDTLSLHSSIWGLAYLKELQALDIIFLRLADKDTLVNYTALLQCMTIRCPSVNVISNNLCLRSILQDFDRRMIS